MAKATSGTEKKPGTKTAISPPRKPGPREAASPTARGKAAHGGSTGGAKVVAASANGRQHTRGKSITKTDPSRTARPAKAGLAKAPPTPTRAKAATSAKAQPSPARAASPQRAASRVGAPARAAEPRPSAPARPKSVRAAADQGRPRKLAVAKTISVEKAEPRRGATRQTAPSSRGTISAAPPPRAAHSFTVSHLNEDDFKADGLRAYAKYRDLGIAAASGGLCQAHVIRFTPPCTDEVRKRHAHSVDLQLVYVLQGWMKNEFEGIGEQMMSAGSCWIQPSGIHHTVLDYSADCEVLEVILPADFKTNELT